MTLRNPLKWSRKFLPLLARILIAAPFVMMGLDKLAAPGATIDYFAAMGVPVPPLAIVVSVVIELAGALLLLSGYGVRIAR
jgi:putative oxidoreductase